jgi:hypothetical protein
MTRQPTSQEQTMTDASTVTVTLTRMSDAHLDLVLAGHASIGMHERAVKYLRDSSLAPAQRERAVRLATTVGNMKGGRWSDNVWEAISLVAAHPDSETYPERFAREDRERQQAARTVALQVAGLRFAG